MAKPGSIHSNYREITYVMSNGEERKVRSTYPHANLKLDIDPLTHPAWNSKNKNEATSRATTVSSFRRKFSNMDFLNMKEA